MRNSRERGCLLVIDGYVVDVSSYIGEHVCPPFLPASIQLTFTQPGGAVFLRRYAVPGDTNAENEQWKKASWAFGGGMNVHSRIAKSRMASMRIARLVG